MLDIIYYEELDSTNVEARRRLEAGEITRATLIYAGLQSSGRGRFLRRWESPKGNVYATFVIKEELFSFLGYVISFSIMESLLRLGLAEEKIELKWPNDVLISGKKVSGILIETCKEYLIIGIGINVISHPELGRGNYKATDLKAEGLELDRDDVVKMLSLSLMNNIERYKAEGFDELRQAWLNKAYNLGKEIEVRNLNNSVRGIFKGIDETGALLLEEENGKERKVLVGDVFYNE